MQALTEVAEVIGDSPGVAADILQSEAWNSHPREVTALLEKGHKLRQLRQALEAKFRPDAFDTEHAGDISYIEQKSSGIFSWLFWIADTDRSHAGGRRTVVTATQPRCWIRRAI